MGVIVVRMSNPDDTYLLGDEYGVTRGEIQAAEKAIHATPQIPVILGINGTPVEHTSIRVAREFDTIKELVHDDEAMVEIYGENLKVVFVVKRDELVRQLTEAI